MRARTDRVPPARPNRSAETGVGARPEVVAAVVVLAVGVLAGLLWAWLAPTVRAAADPGEREVAGDGTLAVLCLAAGLLTAIALAVRPGPRPALRFAVVVLASAAGGFVALGVGRALGAPTLRALAIPLLWALVVAVGTALRVLVSIVISPH